MFSLLHYSGILAYPMPIVNSILRRIFNFYSRPTPNIPMEFWTEWKSKPGQPGPPRNDFLLAGKDLRFDNALGRPQGLQQFLQRHDHIRCLGSDGDQSGAVGGRDGIDGLDIGIVPGEAGQNGRKYTRLIMQHHLERNDAAGGHILERQDRIPVLIESASADIRTAGCLVNGRCLTGGQQALGFRHLQKNFRQSLSFNTVKLGIIGHLCALLIILCQIQQNRPL